METTIKINSLADFNLKLFTQLIKSVISASGSVEITIKPKISYKEDLIQRVLETQNGRELYSVEDFDNFVNTVKNDEIIDNTNLKKVKINEKGHFISC